MLTHGQVAILQKLEARHPSHTACIICQPNTEEWQLASELLHFDSHTANGDKFAGTAGQLRTFFQQVNELYRHSADPHPEKSLLCDD
jgi:hypothetical protein